MVIETLDLSPKYGLARNPINSPDFFKGGNALFTISNPAGEHYTYKIRKPDRDSPFFVSLLTGPDNENSYTYIGIFEPGAFDLRLTKMSKVKFDTKSVKVLRWALTVFRNGNRPPTGYAIQHEGRCCRCGRTLTTPESIERGMGPDCYAGGF